MDADHPNMEVNFARRNTQGGQLARAHAVARQILRDFTGGNDRPTAMKPEPVVLVLTDDLEFLALLTDKRHDGRIVVFMPDVPSGPGGSVALVKPVLLPPHHSDAARSAAWPAPLRGHTRERS